MASTVALSSLSPYLQDKVKSYTDNNGNVRMVVLESLLSDYSLPSAYRDEIYGLLNGNQNWARYDGYESSAPKSDNEVKKEVKEEDTSENKNSQTKYSGNDFSEYYSDRTFLLTALGNFFGSTFGNIGLGLGILAYSETNGVLTCCERDLYEIKPGGIYVDVNIQIDFDMNALFAIFSDKVATLEKK